MFLFFRGPDIVEDSGAALPVANLSLSSSTITEGASVTATVTLTSAAPVGGASVAFALTGSTAAYVTSSTSGTISVSAGATTGTTVITTADDSTDEANGTVTVTISSPSNCTLGTSSQAFTVADNDAAAGNLLLDNLSAFYRLEEASGTRNDAHGANHLTDTNGVTQLASAKVGAGATFLATSSQSLSVADNSSIGYSGDMTAIVWVFRPAGSTTDFIASKGAGTFAQNEWTIRRSFSGSAVAAFVMYRADGNSAQASISGWTDNAWQMIACRYTAATRLLEVSLNGGATWGTATLSGDPVRKSQPLNLGREGSNYFTGSLDQFGLWKRLLSNAEVGDIYNSGAGRDYSYFEGSPPLPVANLSLSSSSVTEGTTVTATVTLTGGAAGVGGASVAYAITGSTDDIVTGSTPLTGTISIAEGATTGTLSIVTDNDTTDEANGSVTVTISSPSGVTLGATTTATLTIVDNDDPITATDFDVSTYGALGNNTADDTVAIRAAIADAILSTATTVNVIFPSPGSGKTYKVCRQTGDPAWPTLPFIFRLAASNKTIRLVRKTGDTGPCAISCWMPGLANPVTTWTVTGDSYFKIARFAGFEMTGTNLTVDVEDLQILGNFPATGNHGVGGNVSTGDGWDLTHKGIYITAGSGMTLNVKRCVFNGWSGEQIWGGSHNNIINAEDTDFLGTNASALSASATSALRCNFGSNASTGVKVYNGEESFAFGTGEPGQTYNEYTSSIDCVYDGIFSFGKVHIGQALTSMTVQGCTFRNAPTAILISDGGDNMLIGGPSPSDGNTFESTLSSGITTSFLGLYPGQLDGFGAMDVRNNIVNMNSGANSALVTIQTQDIGGAFTIRDNTVNSGVLFGGAYGNCPNFTISNNTIAGTGKDILATPKNISYGTTFTLGTPGVVNPGLFFPLNTPVNFVTTGTLPPELSPGTTYYIKAYVDGSKHSISATPGGAAIAFTGTGTGTPTQHFARYQVANAGPLVTTMTRSNVVHIATRLISFDSSITMMRITPGGNAIRCSGHSKPSGNMPIHLDNIDSIPDGQIIEFYRDDAVKNYELVANPEWNNFSSNVPLGAAQFPTPALRIQKNATTHKFEVIA